MAQYNYWPRYGPENYSFLLSAEEKFDPVASTEWMLNNWGYSIVISIVYVIMIYGGQRFMASRKAFSLDKALFWWNFGLAIFSISGTIRIAPEIFWSVNSNSLTYSICVSSYAQGVTGYWTEKFAFSKIFELIDTAFIVLRKRPLIFLHWYHHITVLVFTWFAYKDHTASGRWFIFMNFLVHAFMYSYYSARALKIQIPKWIAMFITVLQILQMVIGVSIGIATYYLKSSGVTCQHKWTNLYFSFLIYFSYFLLFCNFFYHAYLKRHNRYVNAVNSSGSKCNGNSLNNKCLENKIKDFNRISEPSKFFNGSCKNSLNLNNFESSSSSTKPSSSSFALSSEFNNEDIDENISKNSVCIRRKATEQVRHSSPPITRTKRVS